MKWSRSSAAVDDEVMNFVPSLHSIVCLYIMLVVQPLDKLSGGYRNEDLSSKLL